MTYVMSSCKVVPFDQHLPVPHSLAPGKHHSTLFLLGWLSQILCTSDLIQYLSLCCCLITKLSDSSATPWIIACQVPLSMGFSRQEYWSELLFPSPGDLSGPGIKLRLLHWQADYIPLRHQGSPSVFA